MPSLCIYVYLNPKHSVHFLISGILRSSIKHVDPDINITELYIVKKNYEKFSIANFFFILFDHLHRNL